MKITLTDQFSTLSTMRNKKSLKDIENDSDAVEL